MKSNERKQKVIESVYRDVSGIYPENLEQKIGFDAVRRTLESLCSGEASRRHVRQMRFATSFKMVRNRLEETKQMLDVMTGDDPIPLNDIDDVTPVLSHVRAQGAYMDLSSVNMLRRQLQGALLLQQFFSHHIDKDTGKSDLPNLDHFARRISGVEPALAAISRVLTREGEIKDNATPELADIRRQLSGIGARISNAMRRVLSRGIAEGFLDADVQPAMRDGRLVVPVAPMHKRTLGGIVHDESATGKTVYIEPAEVVELNNQQRELEFAERREIINILIALTDSVRPHIDGLLNTAKVMIYFDFLRAKARYAQATGATMPVLSDKAQLEWYGARHPVLDEALKRQQRQIVPLDIALDDEHRLLIISGPNAGGKSVTLKTTGIVQYMTQCGLMPTVYENSHIGIFDGIFADIGDDQSLEDDLSTYSSHLRNMKHFLFAGGNRTLILIDEFGAGTEPQIGGAIAQALLEQYNAKSMWGVITTHYQNLKTMAEHTPGLVNGSMLYDRGRMMPLFKLSIGYPGSSFAIEIARKTGLPSSIIDEASRIVGEDYVNLDKYLLDIARDKKYWENKRDRIRQREKVLEETIARYTDNADELRRNTKSILNDARRQADEIIAGSNAAVERAIHDIRKAQADREQTIEARRKLADERQRIAGQADTPAAHPLLENAPKAKKQRKPKEAPVTSAKPIEPGDSVLLDNAGSVGTVIDIDSAHRKANVAFGVLKMQVDLKRLTRTMRKSKSVSQADSFVSASTTDSMRSRQLSFNPEIDVRGMRADEAIQAVTYFIDDAVQFSAGRVRILHGTGTGALRVAIRQYLDTVPGISDYHDEDVRFGGAGITVVDL